MSSNPVDADALLDVAGVPDRQLMDDIKALIIDAERNRPRSTQRALGPSEVGHRCVRRLAYGTVNSRSARPDITKGQNQYNDPMAAIIGTAMHAWLEDAVRKANERLGRIRWIPEQKVTVREGLSGTCDVYDVDTKTVLDWKGLELDTPIPTPTGWSTIEQLQVGDQVFAADGSPCTVTAKSPVFERDCYRITFEDGTSVVCDNVHEWTFDIDGKTKTLSTESAVDQVWSKAKRKQRQLRIVNNGPLDLPTADLPVPPYTLGAWLGDGDSDSGRIAKPDDELFDHIRADGYEVGEPSGPKQMRRRVVGLTADLRKAGVLVTKHIPDRYLRASYEQRLALLQGLMDTDGSWNRTRNQAVFCTVRRGLAHAVTELISSLGWKPRVWELTKHGFGKEVIAYDVTFIPFGRNPFRMSRKAELVRIEGTARSKRRIVQEIVPVETVPTQCITVDSPDSTFLCGREMIPTHNCPGTSRFSHYSKHGPSNTYRGQAHLYGKGYRNLGVPVENVGIIFISRTGTLKQMHLWREPYNEVLVQEILTRLDMAHKFIEEYDLENDPSGFLRIPITPDDDCTFCPWWTINPTGPRQCGGQDEERNV